MRGIVISFVCSFVLVVAGCDTGGGTDSGPSGMDSGADGGDTDGGVDTGVPDMDAGTDAGGGDDGGSDAGADAATDAGGMDGGADAGVDAGTDAGTDAGVDAGMDAGVDAGPPTDAGFDAGFDAGPPPDAGPVMSLYSCSRDDNNLRRLNVSTGATLSMVAMTMTSFTVSGCTGLATHPTTGTIYMIVRTTSSGSGGRRLGTVNQTTGVVTDIGTVRGGLATIAFDAGGTLYAVTGDGATPAETLYTINITTGVETMVAALGNGDDGEAIAYNPRDGLMYHLSGLSTIVYESIDLSSPSTPTAITRSGFAFDETTCMVFDPFMNLFLAGSISDEFFAITATGVAGSYGTLDHTPKGLAFALP